MASVKLLFIALGGTRLLNPDPWTTYRAIPHQIDFIYVGEGMSQAHTGYFSPYRPYRKNTCTLCRTLLCALHLGFGVLDPSS